MAGRGRVLIVITLAEVGGAQTYVAQLVPALVRHYDVTVAASGDRPLRDATTAAGATFVPLRHMRRALGPRDVLALVELYRLCRRLRPQVLHANSSKAGVLGRLAAALARVPRRIFTVHGWAFQAYPGRAGRLYLLADRAMRPLTTDVICVAERERQAGIAARTCDPRRTTVIHNAVDAGAAPRSRLEGAPPVVLSVGRLGYPKDFVTLVGALGRLGDRSFRARVVGDGADRPAVEAAIAAEGIEQQVELLGTRDDVPQQLAEADVFVLSSRSEGLPMSILEAMAAGVPVVASAVGGVGELVVDGETGLLVPAADVDALADALARLLDDRELRARMGEAARRRVEELFDLDDFHAAHLRVYAGGVDA